MKKAKNFKALVLALMAVSTLVSGCSDDVENRGYVTKFSDFTKIQPGVSTKYDVQQTLGSPTTKSMYGEETWIYVGTEETKETFFEPEVKNYEGYVITFADNGVVSAVNKRDRSNLKEVELSEDKTKTTGNEITVIQQLMGNLGKFNPADRGSRVPGPTGTRSGL